MTCRPCAAGTRGPRRRSAGRTSRRHGCAGSANAGRDSWRGSGRRSSRRRAEQRRPRGAAATRWLRRRRRARLIVVGRAPGWCLLQQRRPGGDVTPPARPRPPTGRPRRRRPSNPRPRPAAGRACTHPSRRLRRRAAKASPRQVVRGDHQDQPRRHSMHWTATRRRRPSRVVHVPGADEVLRRHAVPPADHRAGIYVLQCGDPTGTRQRRARATTSAVENAPQGRQLPGRHARDGPHQRPDSNGSQFFIVYKDTQLPTDAAATRSSARSPRAWTSSRRWRPKRRRGRHRRRPAAQVSIESRPSRPPRVGLRTGAGDERRA